MKLILNECDILKKSLEEGYIDTKKPTNTIRMLTKHYLSIGMNVKQVIYSIDNFFSKHMENYNSVKWINTIETMVKKIHKSKDYRLLDIKKVEITKSELNTIRNIGNEKQEKLAFTLLIYAKIYNQINNNDKNWVNAEHKYIFSDAKLAVNIQDQGKMIHRFNEMDLTESAIIVDKTNIKVKFIDDDSPVVLVVSDFRNFVYEYLRWKGKNIGSCEECGMLFSPTNNSHKYCLSCSKKIWKEQHREINREHMRRKRSVDKTENS